jgi:Cu2+-containing amine oxidase
MYVCMSQIDIKNSNRYNMGFHHVPRQEDWPVMPTTWFSFSIEPVNFYTVNPSINLADKPLSNEICL